MEIRFWRMEAWASMRHRVGQKAILRIKNIHLRMDIDWTSINAERGWWMRRLQIHY